MARGKREFTAVVLAYQLLETLSIEPDQVRTGQPSTRRQTATIGNRVDVCIVRHVSGEKMPRIHHTSFDRFLVTIEDSVEQLWG